MSPSDSPRSNSHNRKKPARDSRPASPRLQAFPRLEREITIAPEEATELLKFFLRGSKSMAPSAAVLRLFNPAEAPPPAPTLFEMPSEPPPSTPATNPSANGQNVAQPTYRQTVTFPAGAPTAAAASLPASELYSKLVEPYLRKLGRAKATFDEYSGKLKLWREFWSSSASEASAWKADASPEPPANQLTSADLVAFREWLMAPPQPKRSEDTINNFLKIIRNVLSIAARKLNVPIVVPHCEKLETTATEAKITLRPEQVSDLYRACEIATWPSHQPADRPPALQWRAAIVLFWFYGFRTQELISYDSKKHPLQWRNIAWDAECPLDGSEVRNESGWLWYTPTKQRRKKPRPLVLPLTPVVAAHLRSLEPFNGADLDQPLFPWPRTQSKLLAQWNSIINASGVRLKRSFDGNERDIRIKHMRKTCATAHERNQPVSSSLVLGHAERRSDTAVTHAHYINAEEVLVGAFAKLSYPPAFDAIFDRQSQQLKLF